MPAGSLPYFNRFHIKPILYYFKNPKLSSINLFLGALLPFSPQVPEGMHFIAVCPVTRSPIQAMLGIQSEVSAGLGMVMLLSFSVS